MGKNYLNKPGDGLTLIELMVTMVILVIVLTMSAPAMQSLLGKSLLRSEAHRMMAALNLARSESLLRNVPVSLCPSTMSSTGVAECTGTYAGGWMVFANPGRDRTLDKGVDEVLQVFPPLPRGFSLTNRDGSRQLTEVISYLPDGSSRANRTLLLCPRRGARVRPLGIVMNIVGRPRLAEGWGQCAGV